MADEDLTLFYFFEELFPVIRCNLLCLARALQMTQKDFRYYRG
jgi:hypothetical protein